MAVVQQAVENGGGDHLVTQEARRERGSLLEVRDRPSDAALPSLAVPSRHTTGVFRLSLPQDAGQGKWLAPMASA
jgi:hypothetical protein